MTKTNRARRITSDRHDPRYKVAFVFGRTIEVFRCSDGTHSCPAAARIRTCYCEICLVFIKLRSVSLQSLIGTPQLLSV
ncbi:hypothetical protein [Pseudooctadecabacter sp.]|uniref:hypothetical protein n=1 Tax=Pseudooctadecabacter sp. TaxID=1966338 RepID=UPI0035C87E83